MKRIYIKIAIVMIGATVALALAIFIFVGTFRTTPSEAVVRQEFLERYPTAVIRNMELIFEQNGNVVYLITARLNYELNEGKYDFALHYSDGKWSWCDDTKERKCKKLWE